MKIRFKNHHGWLALSFCLGVAAFGVQYDLYNSISPSASLNPGAKTASTNNGSSVDLKGYGSATVIVPFGLWSDGTHKIQIEESANNSSWSTVSSTEILGSTVSVSNATDDNTVYSFGYLGDARYLRVSGYVSGSTTSGAVYGGLILRGHPITLPTN